MIEKWYSLKPIVQRMARLTHLVIAEGSRSYDRKFSHGHDTISGFQKQDLRNNIEFYDVIQDLLNDFIEVWVLWVLC